jgi:hypothetical protein
MKTQVPLFLIIFCVACFMSLPKAQAVSPPPDGGYAGFNTAEGTNALKNLSTGVANSAVGWYSLFSNGDGSFNTAVGAGTLLFNVGNQSTGEGTQNTAVGAAALLFNGTGFLNTAIGAAALLNNTEGGLNTAVGVSALQSNTSGERNSAFGWGALYGNLTSAQNCAFGYGALSQNDSSGAGLADRNNAFGVEALRSNVDGDNNNGFGAQALASNVDGTGNSAFGDSTLVTNESGGLNTAIGLGAGYLIDGSGNVCIGANVLGNTGENNITRIKNVGSNPIVGGINVVITGTNPNGDLPLGYASSSRRYKEDIQPIDKASETLFALKPVSFRAKGDPAHIRYFGFIAEDVAAVDPDLAVHNQEGKPETIRFDSINAMLLNEFLKEHRKVQELRREMDAVRAELKEQRDLIQKVSARLETREPTELVTKNP